jgi:serine/threonine-protein kinase HipA
MSPRRTTPAVSMLQVLLDDDLVGTLTHLPDDRTVWSFDPAYVADTARPTLSLSYKNSAGQLRSRTRPTHVKLPPFFSNLLPEGHLREYLAEKGRVNPAREFFLLWLLGEDLPGAVRVRSADGHALPPAAGPAVRPAPKGADEPLRFSLAGMQLKLSALQEADGGLTIPVRGVGGTWIAKLPSTRFAAVPENEYVMMTLAKAVGITVPDVALVAADKLLNVPEGAFTGSGRVLVVRRFDRAADGTRLHMEDFAQVFGKYPKHKYGKASYEDIARVLWAETGEDGIREFTRRLVVTVLIGNGDMHLKNWSVLYPDRRAPILSPAYDFVSTVPYVPNETLALSLGESKDMLSVDENRFVRFARRAGLPDRLVAAVAVDTADRLHEAWRSLDAKDLLPQPVRDSVEAHLAKASLGRRT